METVAHPELSPQEEARKAQMALNDALDTLAGLKFAVENVIYTWKQFDEPTLEQRKNLYQAYVRAGGKP